MMAPNGIGLFLLTNSILLIFLLIPENGILSLPIEPKQSLSGQKNGMISSSTSVRVPPLDSPDLHRRGSPANFNEKSTRLQKPSRFNQDTKESRGKNQSSHESTKADSYPSFSDRTSNFVAQSTNQAIITSSSNHQAIHPSEEQIYEGSGAGPPKGDRFQKQKYDDNEDSDDNDDEDYEDEKSAPDNGPNAKTSRKPASNLNITTNSASNIGSAAMDVYNPFRPPTKPPREQFISQEEQVKHIHNSLSSAIIPPITSANQINTRPVTAAPSTQTISTIYNTIPTVVSAPTPPSTLAKAKHNSSLIDSEYDYEDENGDEDSEESSAFVDNDPNELDELPSRNMTLNAQNNTPSYNRQHNQTTTSTTTERPTLQSESIHDYYQHSKSTARPLERDKNKSSLQNSLSLPNRTHNVEPPSPIQATNSPIRSPKDNLDDDDDDEDDDDKTEADDEDEDKDEDGGDEDLNSDFNEAIKTNLSSSAQKLNPNKQDNIKLTISPPYNANTDSPKLPDGQMHDQTIKSETTTPTTSKQPSRQHDKSVKGVIPPTTANAINFYSTTSVPLPTRPSVLMNLPKQIVEHSTMPSVAISQFSQTTTIATRPPTTILAATVTTKMPAFIFQKPLPAATTTTMAPPTYFQTFPLSTTMAPYLNTFGYATTQTNPYYKPATPTTTHIMPYDNEIAIMNDDSLSRQMYDKVIEVYYGTERTLKQAWETIWPANMNFEASGLEPLLAQPMFFMFALGGAVIGLVLLMMLVVYIITYQIQPSENDDISLY